MRQIIWFKLSSSSSKLFSNALYFFVCVAMETRVLRQSKNIWETHNIKIYNNNKSKKEIVERTLFYIWEQQQQQPYNKDSQSNLNWIEIKKEEVVERWADFTIR